LRVTYRDDHDAALARASALADELKRSEAERDRLLEQVAKLEQVTKLEKVEPPRSDPPVALAPAKPSAMTAYEVDELVQALEHGGQRIRAWRIARMAGAGLLILVAIAMCFASRMLPALLVLALGIVALVTSVLVDDGDHALVIEAVRNRPEEIAEIRESVTTKGNRWVTISARDGTSARFLPTATTVLVVALARRCPEAKLR
jgi:hypothetical protein